MIGDVDSSGVGDFDSIKQALYAHARQRQTTHGSGGPATVTTREFCDA